MTPTPQEYSSTQLKSPTTPASGDERIVISGMSGLYPASGSVKEFSDTLYNKVNPVTKAGVRFKSKHPEVPQHGGSVPGLNNFDAQFFKVHYRLCNSMDPMARKILEQSYQAIYDAGINPEVLSGKKVGVYIGTCFSETEKAFFYEFSSRFTLGLAGCSKTMYANRVSYWLNAKGPSMSIDAACCSSTAALEQAYLAMSRGDCEAAIVGGAYLCLHPQSFVHYGRIMKLCRDGKTKSFDENADGCAKSEAINVLFLQKAKDALRIYGDVLHVKSEFTCVLPGKTGPKYGFYRDVDKTVNFMKSFYEEASIPAHAVEYVEASGCAVTDADKAELQAIEQVFCNKRNDALLVGSVTSNIGNSDAASGISAITKVLLGYHTGQLAANLHCSSPRQDVAALREGRMRIVTDHERFRRTYVAVSGMSITGLNSHVLLHGHYKPKEVNRYTSSIPYLVTISARQDSAVTYILDNLKSNPIDPEQLRLLHNIHQTSIPGHLGRGFIILKTNEDHKTVSLCEKAEYFDDARRPLWFVYSGMGSQWAGMGTQLMRIPIFATAIERCRQILEPKGLDIVAIITSLDETFDNILHSFVGIAAIQIGLTDVLRELGLVPDGIIGHSVGELGCAYADGCLTAEEMILSAYSRGLVSLQTPFIRGSMAAIGLGYKQISEMCPAEIEVACHNGPESSTISGPADVMREFVAELTAKGIFAKEVPCSNIAYHSRYIADAGPQLLKYLSEVIKTPKPRSERWLSTSVPQDRWNDPIAKLCSAEYHTNNLLSPVFFEETSRLVPSNAVLVEVAPHGLLQAILKRSLPSDCKNIPLTRRNHPDNAFLLLEGIGTLFMEGWNPKVHVLYPKVELPVSTGTPFLSHLVRWADTEKWPLAFYNSADRKTTSECNHKISLHDSENSYLQGNSIRGHTLYPFAASLVLAWDTLAMVMGVPKKQLSVDFRDLHLYSQPILHDQRLLTLSVALHRGTGRFEILNEGSKVATGYIMVMNKETQKHLSCNYVKDEITLKGDLNAEDIYHLLRDKDYSYSGEFRSISCANQLLNEAELLWSNNWVTLIDGLLQLNALRQPLTSFSLPTHIRRMCIDTHEHEHTIQNSTEVFIKAKVFENFEMTRCGGVTVNNIRWDNLPLLNDKTIMLKALRFVPYFKSNVDDTWGGEDYIPVEDCASLSKNVTLESKQIGDYDSLAWVEAPDIVAPGITVTVQYAGISNRDTQRADGSIAFKNNIQNYGMDFSGITESGERVMGLVESGAASSVVRARPELLWPVPAHWSLEDAATVPLAYGLALYCLVIKRNFQPNTSVLVHGGAGALGQATIALALAHGCQVYTTVSDMRKKQFLLKLFPGLKADNIGSSRDSSFRDLILNNTKGHGCDVVITSLKGDLKETSICCVGSQGICLDISELHNRDKYFSYGMTHLFKERTYATVDFSTIFENTDELKILHRLMSEGISRGYVRPLSRVTYAPHDAARAFRLLAASSHRGKVLLHMEQTLKQGQLRLTCNADRSHLILGNNETLGLQLADRLVVRGAKKLCIHYRGQSMNYLQIKIRSWQKSNVEVIVVSNALREEIDVTAMINNAINLGPLEGIYVTISDSQQDVQEGLLTNLDSVSRKLCPDIKYFAVLTNVTNAFGKKVCISRVRSQLPATMVMLPELSLESSTEVAWCRAAVDLTEKALRGGHAVTRAYIMPPQKYTILQKICKLADITIPENTNKSTTLKELGMESDKIPSIRNVLRVHYNLVFEEEEIPLLTVDKMQQLEKTIVESDFEDVKSLSTFFTYVDSDELLATTDMVFLPTHVNSAPMRDDEFDANETYLCIVPGMEGHHERFRMLCERLKLPAFVLQPGLDRPHETIQETAERFAEAFLKKTGLKNNFYILAYESGVSIALEMAAILEDRGLTGTLYCIGHGPEEFKILLEQLLSELGTDEQLQNAVVRHMFELMTGGDTTVTLENALRTANTWSQKVDACLRALQGRVPHSSQYSRALIEAALARIERTRGYVPRVGALRSQLVLLRAATAHATSSPLELQRHSQIPVAVHQLRAPLAHATRDLRCAAIVNAYLELEIQEKFHHKNICDTYLLNPGTFMSIEDENKY